MGVVGLQARGGRRTTRVREIGQPLSAGEGRKLRLEAAATLAALRHETGGGRARSIETGNGGETS